MINLCRIPQVKANVCRLEDYADWFFLSTFTMSVTNRLTHSAGTEFSQLVLTKPSDACTPQLMAVCCQAKLFDSLSIDVLETSGSGKNAGVHPILKLRFGRLKLIDWSVNKSVETIKFDYLKIACLFSQGKCNARNIETTYYTDTPMMGWEKFPADENMDQSGQPWSGPTAT